MIYEGTHLMVDSVILGRKQSALHDSRVGVEFLESVAEAVDMTILVPPIAINFPHVNSETEKYLKLLDSEGLANSKTAQLIRTQVQTRVEQTHGYTAIMLIAESHVTIHTFPDERFVTFDCYSCKPFDPDAVMACFDKAFGTKRDDCVNVVERRIPVNTTLK